jgi:hypothetical protein
MSSDEAKIGSEDASRLSRWNVVLQYSLPGFAFPLLVVDV